MTTGQAHYKMLYAAAGMKRARKYQSRYVNSRLYETIKKECSSMHSKRLLGRKLTEEHKAKIGAAGIGRINSAETIAKRVASCTGKVRTQEQRDRMSAAQKTRISHIYTDDEKRAISEKLSQSLKGKTTSEETKQKLSNANKGKAQGPRSEETKQKMRKPKSEEHKKAISKGRRAKYAALKSK
jgi:hypothetical protein